jgi:hypothetical protein
VYLGLVEVYFAIGWFLLYAVPSFLFIALITAMVVRTWYNLEKIVVLLKALFKKEK